MLATKIALKNFIKMDNFIDSEDLLKEKNTGTMADVIHPNDKGYGILAQEIYNRFAFSPTLNAKIKSIFEKGISLNQWPSLIAKEIKERDAAI